MKQKWITTSVFILILGFITFQFLDSSDDDRLVAHAIGSYDCPEISKIPDFGKAYKGPLIDTHMHIPHPPEGPELLNQISFENEDPKLGKNITVSDYICNFKTEGITKAFIFFPVFPGLEKLHLSVAEASVKAYPDFIVPFIMPPDGDNDLYGFPTVDSITLDNWLSMVSDLFRGYGEIGLYERRNERGERTGAEALSPDGERLKKIYPVIRKNNLLVYFHLGEGQQAQYENTLSANPDIKFIFHGDQLIKTDDSGKQDLEAIEEILYRHPNVYYGVDELWGDVWILRPDVKKEEFFAHFENYKELIEKDVETWKDFIERHPNQVLWGSDRGVGNSWSMDQEVGFTLTGYVRAFIARLDPSVQEKFAYKNALKLIEKR